MTQIPRKPTFPSYMVQKLRQKIQSDVQSDVIPVSTGIYSYEKLKNKLQAIPKPEIENYEDKIFFEIIEERLGVVNKTGEKCNWCEEEYNMKKNPAVMCNFCGTSCCSNCMPLRKRPHPLSKDGSGKKFNVCQRCDTKYLNLQLGHSYVQNRTLLEQAIVKTSQQLEGLMNECQEYQEILTKSKQTFEKNKFKISQLRKEKLELTKEIKNKMPEEIKLAQDKQEQLKANFVYVHLKHREWIELNQLKRRAKQEEENQRRQKQLQEEEQRAKIQQKERLRRQQEEQEMQEIQMQERQNQIQQRFREEEERLQKKQEQNQNTKVKMKKNLSLQQKSTLSLNLASSNTEGSLERKNQGPLERKRWNKEEYGGYDNFRREESEDEEETFRARQLSKTSMDKNEGEQKNNKQEKKNSKKDKRDNSEQREKKIVDNSLSKRLSFQETHIPLSQQQQQFSDYFRQFSDNGQSLRKKPYDKQQFKTPIKEMYSLNESTAINKKESNYMNELSADKNYDEGINNFSFNDQNVQNHHPCLEQEQNYSNTNDYNYNKANYYQRRQKEQQQYTFSNNLNSKYFNQKQNQTQPINDQPQEIPITSSKPHYKDQQQLQNSKLSFVDEWYVNKNAITATNTTTDTIPNHLKQNSSLSASLNLTNPSKKKKTQEQLEEQCTKSTSELDEDELEIARYSLIKAARDSAVEERQRNKIYQKSIYQTDQTPYDQQQAETVGEIKKCQCTIF